MEPKELKEFSEGILNHPRLTSVLKEKIPQIKKLEEIIGLSDLMLKGINLEDNIFKINYEVTASPEIYANLVGSLIRNRVSGILNTEEVARGGDDKFSTKVIKINYSNGSIFLFLRVYSPYNPNHR